MSRCTWSGPACTERCCIPQMTYEARPRRLLQTYAHIPKPPPRPLQHLPITRRSVSTKSPPVLPRPRAPDASSRLLTTPSSFSRGSPPPRPPRAPSGDKLPAALLALLSRFQTPPPRRWYLIYAPLVSAPDRPPLTAARSSSRRNAPVASRQSLRSSGESAGSRARVTVRLRTTRDYLAVPSPPPPRPSANRPRAPREPTTSRRGSPRFSGARLPATQPILARLLSPDMDLSAFHAPLAGWRTHARTGWVRFSGLSESEPESESESESVRAERAAASHWQLDAVAASRWTPARGPSWRAAAVATSPSPSLPPPNPNPNPGPRMTKRPE
ncbi:hypothetical protein C8Q79DRAFT_538876 [Trametes meyenii]|nr:hypothetical protein C8Q79DRAFT_538876 [Trametes meyenii]